MHELPPGAQQPIIRFKSSTETLMYHLHNAKQIFAKNLIAHPCRHSFRQLLAEGDAHGGAPLVAGGPPGLQGGGGDALRGGSFLRLLAVHLLGAVHLGRGHLEQAACIACA